jgi:putative iron-dependent peroxidase
MRNYQQGILEDVPAHSRYIFYSLIDQDQARSVLKQALTIIDGSDTVIGIGKSTLNAINLSINGMRSFPALTGPGIDIPSTPYALMLWLRGDERGELIHRSHEFNKTLAAAFVADDIIEGFRYRDGDDLTGYEDGTENPLGDEAVNAAFSRGVDQVPDGSSFVAIQQWVHDLDAFQSHSPQEQDHIFGRRISDNEEIEDAPDSAHVKRTAQEDFDPEAFVVRRSMPWSATDGEGLVFAAFGKSFDAYEALLNRMLGKDDGIVDALFSFTRPITGSYFWCPPVIDGKIRI